MIQTVIKDIKNIRITVWRDGAEVRFPLETSSELQATFVRWAQEIYEKAQPITKALKGKFQVNTNDQNFQYRAIFYEITWNKAKRPKMFSVICGSEGVKLHKKDTSSIDKPEKL